MTLLAIIGVILFYLILLAGLVIIPLSFPGTWVMLIAAVIFSLLGDLYPGGSELLALLVVTALAGLGELIELGVRIVGSRMAKVPNGAIVAAIVGGLIGAIIGVPVFLIGSLLGLLLGVFLGAFAYGFLTTKKLSDSLMMAVATMLSQVVALFAKTCVGIAIIVYLTFVLF